VYFRAICRPATCLEFSAYKRLNRGLDDVRVFLPSSILHPADREMRDISQYSVDRILTVIDGIDISFHSPLN